MPLPEYDVISADDLEYSDHRTLDDSYPKVPDVEKAVSRIRKRGEYLRAWDGSKIKGFRYTSLKENEFGYQNHFQGIARLRTGPFAVVSGGDCHEKMAHLFVVRLSTRKGSGHGPWRTNCLFGDPLREDTIVLAIGLDEDLWHAGGMDTLGDILAVPVEKSDPKMSRVLFFDMRDAEHPKRIDLNQGIERDGIKAGAVALTKLTDGRYLCAVWSKQLDFYVSKSTDLTHGFNPQHRTWFPSQARATGAVLREFQSYQTINFIRQTDGELYLAGTRNTGVAASHAAGTDVLHLFQVLINENDSEIGIADPVITKVAEHSFETKHSQGNMDGGACVHVSMDSRPMVYSVFHFRIGPGASRQLRFTEYRSHADQTEPIVDSLDEAWIELYEKPYFEGRFFSLRSERDSWITDYGNLLVHGHRRGFNNKVSSVRYHLPDGVRYSLFEKDNFRKPLVRLVGTGQLEEYTDLGSVKKGSTTIDAARKTSSSRYEYLHPGGNWRISRPE